MSEPDVEDSPTVVRTTAVALALTVAGTLAGLVGALLTQWVVAATVSPVPPAVAIVSTRGVQFGFGAFALAVVARTGAWSEYARFRRPRVADVGWVLVALLALFVVGEVVTELVSLAGLPTGASVGTGAPDYGLAEPSVRWIVALVAWVGVAAPAEEWFYRGIVQTRLRRGLPAWAVVVVAAGCFGISHAFFALLTPGPVAPVATTFVELFAAGLVFAGLYEVTDNLVPVAAFHALTWLDPFDAVASVLTALA